MQEWCYDYNDILEHHGILGQKWGVRRYQYKDGTLTPAGKRRYKVDAEGNIMRKTQREIKQDRVIENEKKKITRLSSVNETTDQAKQRIAYSHDPKQIYDNKDLFTDKELQTLYLRLNTERNISNLIPKDTKNSRYESLIKTLKDRVENEIASEVAARGKAALRKYL